MANNPLYPGYEPKKEGDGMNPMYSGYYPGAPMSRKPKPRNFVQPTSYSTDDLMEEIDAIDFEVNNVGRFIGNRIKDDFKSAFKVSIKPASVKSSELDDYDLESLPGASGMSISTYAGDWEDPGKQAAKTLKGWTKMVLPANPLNAPDVDNRQKKRILNEVIGKGEDPNLPEDQKTIKATATDRKVDTRGRRMLDRSTTTAREATTERLATSYGTRETVQEARAHRNPFDITGKNIRATRLNKKGAEENIDAFLAAGEDFVEAQTQANMPKFRGSSSDSFHRSTQLAAAAEMQQILDNGVGTNGRALTQEQIGRMNDFINTAEVGKSMANLNTVYTGATKSLKKIKLQGMPTSAFEGDFEKMLQQVEKAKQTLRTARSSLSGGALERYNKDFGALETHLSQASGILEKIKPEGGEIDLGNIDVTLRKLNALKSGELIDRGLSGGSTPVANIERNFLRKSIENDFVGAGMGTSGIADTVKDLGMESQKLQMFVNKQAIDRRYGKAEELLNAVAEGEVMERYLWNPVMTKFEKITPAYWVEKAKEKVDSFGLVIDEENLLDANGKANTFLGRVYKKDIIAMGENPLSVKAPGRVLGNHFTRKVKVGDKMKKVRLYGGKHFDYIKNNINNLKTAEGIQEQATRLMAIMRGEEIEGGTNPAERIFVAWVKKNKKLFGKDVNLEDEGFWTSLLESLSKEERFKGSLSITRRYAGLLEKAWTKLNRLQETVLGGFVGKIYGTISNWKTIVSERVSTVISETLSKLLAGLAAAGTGGLGIAIERILAPIIKWATKRVLDFAEKLGKAVLQGDILEVIDALGEATQKTLRKVLAGILIPIMFIHFMVHGFFTPVWTSISPVDPTRLPPTNCQGNKFPQMFPGGVPGLYSKTISYIANTGHQIEAESLEAYAAAEQETGVPCEILAGIHFMEGRNDPTLSPVSGVPIGQYEAHAGQTFKNLTDAMIFSAEEFIGKLLLDPKQPLAEMPPFEKVVTALSWYNGGDNANCGKGVPYKGPCPGIEGIDDPYPMNWFDADHDPMFLIWCTDSLKCADYCAMGIYKKQPVCVKAEENEDYPGFFEMDRPGAIEMAIWFHQTYIGG